MLFSLPGSTSLPLSVVLPTLQRADAIQAQCQLISTEGALYAVFASLMTCALLKPKYAWQCPSGCAVRHGTPSQAQYLQACRPAYDIAKQRAW